MGKKKEHTTISGTWEDVIKASVKGNPAPKSKKSAKTKNMSASIKLSKSKKEGWYETAKDIVKGKDAILYKVYLDDGLSYNVYKYDDGTGWAINLLEDDSPIKDEIRAAIDEIEAQNTDS